MIKLIVMYHQPDNAEAFDKYYNDVHIPLAKKVPGLERLVINRARGNPMGGDSPYYLVAELHFADMEAFEMASQSGEFRDTGADLANFAQGKVTMLIAEAEAV